MNGWIWGGIILAVVVLVLAAIEIPCMMPSGIAAHEVSAVQSIQTITAAQETYRAMYGSYAKALAILGGAQPCKSSTATACLIDDRLAGGTKSGYRFGVTVRVTGTSTAFAVGAAPEQFARSGLQLFCSVGNDVIRVARNEGGSTTPPGFEQCLGLSPLQ